jgi:hypothetical protein
MAARVGFGALWLGFVLAVAAVWGGCSWHNAPRDCTTPGAYQCVNNTPYRCMTGDQVLRPVRDPCGPGEACALTTGTLAATLATCLPTTPDAEASDAAAE